MIEDLKPTLAYPVFRKISDALAFFEKFQTPLTEGLTCHTADGKYQYKNGEWQKVEKV